jgi:hypothetical protein
MLFCTRHSHDLEEAFASLSLSTGTLPSSDSTRNQPVRHIGFDENKTITTALLSKRMVQTKPALTPPGPAPEDELSTILTALRKLREGLLASSKVAPLVTFSQRVHVFNVRLALLALHPPSYHPSLIYLLQELHSHNHPLPVSEHVEMTTYLILDLALRQNDLIAAYDVKSRSKLSFGYANRDVDTILRSITTNNWVAFWRTYRRVDGHVRAVMQWYIEALRKTTLKAFGRAYLKTELKWLLSSSTGNNMSWEELVQTENIGWLRDADTIIIRKPKAKS